MKKDMNDKKLDVSHAVKYMESRINNVSEWFKKLQERQKKK